MGNINYKQLIASVQGAVSGYEGPKRILRLNGESFESALDEIEKDPGIAGLVSRQTIGRKLTDLLREVADTQGQESDGLESAVRDLVKALRGSVHEWTAYVPIDNLHFEDFEELNIGAVTFRPFPANAGDLPPDARRILIWKSRSTYAGLVYAEVTVKGEHHHVPQIVDSHVDAGLNLLRCYTHVLFGRSDRAFIGLPGVVSKLTRPYVYGSSSARQNVSAARSIGYHQPYSLSRSKLENLRLNYGFDALLTALTTRPQTELQKAVVAAMHWTGRGVVAPEMSEQILCFAIGLEALLGLRGSDDLGSISDRVSRRLAFLHGTDTADCKRRYSHAGKLYGLRSKVVHEGRIEVERKDVEELERVARDTLFAVAKRCADWSTFDDVRKWELDEMFSRGKGAKTVRRRPGLPTNRLSPRHPRRLR